MIRINLLPVKAARKRYGGLMQLVLMGCILLFTAVVLWAPVPIWKNRAWMANQIDQRQQELDNTKAEIQRLERIIGQVNQFTEKKKSLEKTKEIITQLKSGKTGPVRLLDELAVLTPDKVWIVSMQEKGKNLTLAGEAVGYEDVSLFMTQLQNSEFFSAVTLRAADADSDSSGDVTWVKFTISARVIYSI